jgi:voltage-gated potassium channel
MIGPNAPSSKKGKKNGQGQTGWRTGMRHDSRSATIRRLKRIVETTDTPAAKAFGFGIQFLILVSTVGFCLDTLPDLNPAARATLRVLEVVTVALFTLEYVLRILVADRPWAFIFSFFGLVDLIAILPFYVAAGVDLRGLRLLRLFRAFRILKLLRYTQAMERFGRAFLAIREELVLYLLVATILVFFSSVGIYHFEREAQPQQFGTIFHCIWWSIITLTTVGYGDVYPITVGGRVFTAMILFLGLGIIAVPAGLLAASLTETRVENLAVLKTPRPKPLATDSPDWEKRRR